MELDQIKLWNKEELTEKVKNLATSNKAYSRSLGDEIVKYLETCTKKFDGNEYDKVSKSWLSWLFS